MKSGHQEATHRKPERLPNYLWIAIISGIALIWFSKALGYSFPFIAFWVVVCCITLTATRPGHIIKAIIILLLLGFLLVISIPNCGVNFTASYNNGQVRGVLWKVWHSNHMYSMEHDGFCTSMRELTNWDTGSYLNTATTPYTWHRDGQLVPWVNSAAQSHPVNETGWPDDANRLAGDFIYVPRWQKQNEGWVVSDFTLIGFGWPKQKQARNLTFPINVAVPVCSLTKESHK